MVVKIAVLGGGINGLACAVQIREKYTNSQVVLIASEFSPKTTGDGAAGLWSPYLSAGTPMELLAKWGMESYRFLHERWLEGGLGICLVPVYKLNREQGRCSEPNWAGEVFGYHTLSDSELEYCGRVFSGKFAAGYTFSSFTFWPTPFLGYLLDRFKKANGEVLQATVGSLRDPILAGFDVIVNCTGLNARNLVPDDGVFPYRGQVIRVIAPWIMEVVVDEDNGNYIIPNADTCVLGGTSQQNNYNTKIDAQDSADILSSCHTMKPSLKSAAPYSEWVGLRPGRYSVRLEAELKDGTLVIHNYGHGGCGLTLFWGCAKNVVQLLDEHLQHAVKQHSKL